MALLIARIGNLQDKLSSQTSKVKSQFGLNESREVMQAPLLKELTNFRHDEESRDSE